MGGKEVRREGASEREEVCSGRGGKQGGQGSLGPHILGWKG